MRSSMSAHLRGTASSSTRTDRPATAAGLNGYSVIQAEGRSEALDLLRDHPLLALDGDWVIEVFEVPKR